MPRGPKGQKRPADVIGAAVMIGKIATGEIEEDLGETEDGKDKAAAALTIASAVTNSTTTARPMKVYFGPRNYEFAAAA